MPPSPGPGCTSRPAPRGSSSTRREGRIPAGPARAPTRRSRPRSRARSRSSSPVASTREPSPARSSRSPRSASTSPPAWRRRASPGSGRARTRSRSPCSSSAPAPPASTARTPRPGRRRSTRVFSRPTRAATGASSATSAVASCPRRWSARSSSSRHAWAALRDDPVFWAELRELLARFAGRPTALYRADRLAAAVLAEAARLNPGATLPARLRVHLKREDLAHTGAHKINNALGQALLTRRLGKTRVIAETGRRPARRRHGDRLRPARPALRRLHGRGGHPPPGPERPPDAGPRHRGPLRHVRHGDAQGRRQRGDARLGHERRDHPLRPRLRDGPAPLPDDRARPPAPDRRRGGGAAPRGRGTPARPRPRLRRGRLERDRAARPLHRGAVGAARRGRGGRRRDRDGTPRGGDPRRLAGDPPRVALAACSRTATGRSSRR